MDQMMSLENSKMKFEQRTPSICPSGWTLCDYMTPHLSSAL